VRKADNLPPSSADVTKSGNLIFLELSGPLQACNGTVLHLTFTKCWGSSLRVTIWASCTVHFYISYRLDQKVGAVRQIIFRTKEQNIHNGREVRQSIIYYTGHLQVLREHQLGLHNTGVGKSRFTVVRVEKRHAG
jgi:hypothetical protein